ncbi:MAG: hypothetical protein Q7V57_06655 [Actinomycetota bacterium]|nr:hypothetical protein [Actinomycetota bacterium]
MATKRSLLSPTVLLRRNALYKGVFGGSRGWMVVGAVVWGPRLLKRFAGRQERVLTTEKLVAGQTLQITALRPPTRQQRRAAARTR